MKKKINYKYKNRIVVTGLCVSLLSACLFTTCGSKEESNVEQQVSEAIMNSQSEESEETDKNIVSSDECSEVGAGTEGDSDTPDTADKTGGNEKTNNTGSNATGKLNNVEVPKYSTNPFLGSNSTSTQFNLKFCITTDSGIAGITWGSMDGTDGEYYLWAFDCTRDIPRLYTSRRMGEDVWDENYYNLDMMYPEMSMFTTIKHFVEIVVDGTTVTTYLDSVEIARTTIAKAMPIGLIGTWVMDGDYHALFDDIFMTEGIDGSGEYLYSEDFVKKKNIFYPFLDSKNGQLYAKAGYYTVLPTEKK